MSNLKQISNNLKSYRTKHERDALLYVTDTEFNYQTLLEKLGVEKSIAENLSDKECEYLIFKLRSISVGEMIEFQYECGNCKKTTVAASNIDDMFADPIHTDIPEGLFYDEHIDESIEHMETVKNIEELSITEYDELYNKFEDNNKVLFNSNAVTNCVLCGTQTIIPIAASDIISKITIKSLYENITELMYYSNNGYNDIMEMIPFEREIIISLINSIKENE